MKLNELLLERFVNLTSAESKENVYDEVLKQIHDTYKNIGGAGTLDKENLTTTPGLWKLVKKNNKIICGILYKDSYGRKIRLVFHNQSQTGKEALKKILKEDIFFKRSWVECCEPLESCLIKLGCEKISADHCEVLIGSKPSKIHSDGFHYDREVNGGMLKTQILLGSFK